MKHLQRMLALVAIALQPAMFGGTASAQDYPQRPIRLVVGFPPGGGADIMARLLAPKLAAELGGTMFIDNKPGASATIGVGFVAKAPPDGYTLLVSTPTDTVQPSLMASLPYDYERDLTHIALFAVAPMALVVGTSFPATDVAQVIAAAKAAPGKLNYGSAGIGSAVHLAGELFNQIAHVEITHVPYKGASEAVRAVATGEIPMAFVVLSGAMPMIEAGRIRPLAVTSLERSPLMPMLPTLNQSGVPGYDLVAWWGVSAPGKMPRELVTRINRAVVKVVNDPEMIEQFAKQGIQAKTSSPEAFTAFIHRDIAMDAQLLKTTGVAAKP